MSSFTVLLLCIQACLVQNVFSYCSSRAGLAPAACGAGLAPTTALSPLSYAPTSIAYGPVAGIGSATAIGSAAAYGGAGEGNVAVIGELPLAGETIVGGQVPITGVVGFSGAVPAAGAVSINGHCSCGCSSIY